MKDKLWYFVSGEYWNQEPTPIGAADASDQRTTPRYLGKLTWQANEGNRLMFMAEYDDLMNERRGIGEYTLPEATVRSRRRPNDTFALNWESLINASNFINVKLTGYVGELNYLPYNGNDTPGRDDYWDTEIDWQNQKTGTTADKQQITFDASWSLFKDGLLTDNDDHSFKFGALVRGRAATYLQRRNGGVHLLRRLLRCRATPPRRTSPTRRAPRCGGTTFIEPTTAASTRNGCRPRRSACTRRTRCGSTAGRSTSVRATASTTAASSRATATPTCTTRASSTRASASCGTSSAPAAPRRRRTGAATTRRCSATSTTARRRGRSPSPTGTATGTRTTVRLDSNGDPGCDLGTPEYATMGDYGHQYVDETLLTFEQQFGQDMMIGVDLIDRRFRDIMAMINVNDDYTLLTATTTRSPAARCRSTC